MKDIGEDDSDDASDDEDALQLASQILQSIQEWQVGKYKPTMRNRKNGKKTLL